MTILIPYSPGAEPGTWHPTGPGSKANVICPDCARALSLSRHNIGNSGKVSGYVQCLTQGCGWSDELMLDEWGERRNDIEMHVDPDESRADIEQPQEIRREPDFPGEEPRTDPEYVPPPHHPVREAMRRVLNLVGKGNNIETDAELIQIAKLLMDAAE